MGPAVGTAGAAAEAAATAAVEAAAAKSLQSCPTLCDPTDGSPPGSPIPGIPQATKTFNHALLPTKKMHKLLNLASI